MTINKKKKARKQRGRKTHGWGSKKKRRGKGNKGGSGRAGLGKRGSHKLPSYRNKGFSLGQKGFTRPIQESSTQTINLEDIQNRFNSLLENKKIKKEDDFFVINLTELGFDKLLGSGNIGKKMKIFVKAASKNAEEKVNSAAGQIIYPKEKQKKEAPEKKKKPVSKEPEKKKEQPKKEAAQK